MQQMTVPPIGRLLSFSHKQSSAMLDMLVGAETADPWPLKLTFKDFIKAVMFFHDGNGVAVAHGDEVSRPPRAPALRPSVGRCSLSPPALLRALHSSPLPAAKPLASLMPLGCRRRCAAC